MKRISKIFQLDGLDLLKLSSINSGVYVLEIVTALAAIRYFCLFNNREQNTEK